MINNRVLLFTIAAALMLVNSNPAQPPPASKKTDGKVVRIVQEPALRNLSSTEKFSSVDGRYSILLPTNVSGFSSLTPKSLGINAAGGMFQWRLREGMILISYQDFLDPNFSVSSDQDYANYFAGVKDGVLNSLKGKLVSDKLIKLDKYRGYEFRFEMPNSMRGIARTYYVEKRNYTLIAALTSVDDAESLVFRAFDSLELVSRSDTENYVRKSLEAATPQALPQGPVIKKENSDAEDEGIKGNVKSITNESEDLSGTTSVQNRHISTIEDFDERGNYTKRISFDSYAKPFQVTVYGYIDGSRVSKSQSIRYEYDPPPMMAVGSYNDKSKTPSDSRYEYKLQYKYVDSRLVEKQLINNNGQPGLRYVSNYNGNKIEELVYDENGKLNQKYLLVVDEKGNEIERVNVDVFPSQIYGDRKYTVKYDLFDDRGNWIKKTTSKLVKKNGKELYKGWYITYRTIVYWK